MKWFAALALVVLAGCGGDEIQPDGGVVLRDAGSSTTLKDAGASLDSGTALDASIDPTDAGGSTFDSGLPALDAGLFDAGTPATPVCGRCSNGYTGLSNAGTVQSTVLNEASGLAASHAHPGVLYSHNDSGGEPVIYVMSTSGADLGQLVLTGASNADWEDISMGPCPTGTCIYVGEIGDNNKVNPGPYAVYRVAEPAMISATVPVGSLEVSYEKFMLRYPNDEKHNAETLMVHPVTGDVYVVSKEQQFVAKSVAYKATAPLSTANINDLVKIATLKVPDKFDLEIVAGDIDACGTTMLLRSYSAMYQFTLGPGAAFDTIFTSGFSRVTSPVLRVEENQGEAVAWAVGGGYYTVSEGSKPMLHYVGCK